VDNAEIDDTYAIFRTEKGKGGKGGKEGGGFLKKLKQ